MASRFQQYTLIGALVVLAASCASSGPQRAPTTNDIVTATDLQKNENEPIENVIQRKISGVTVMRTNGSISLQIRGNTSLKGEYQPPLYVLNDMPFHPGPDGLASLNRHEIDNIKVLKGPQAAIYGIEGAHGVVVITTKNPGLPQ